MPKIAYTTKRFGAESLRIIELTNDIIEDYAEQGFNLTLRQIYYQFVARDEFPENRRWRWTGTRWVRDLNGTKNADPNYKWLGGIINDARLAGLIDWHALEDRTRNLQKLTHWTSPGEIIEACINQYRVDKWATQQYRPECFPKETKITTLSKPQNISDIKIGDKVLSDDGTFQKVSQIYKRRYRGQLVRIKTIGAPDFRCTPEHPIWADLCDTKTKYKGSERKFVASGFSMAAALKKHDVLRIPRIKKTKNKTAILMKGGKRSKKIATTLDRNLCALIGLYLAEGRIREDGRTVQFTFHKDELEFFEKVTEWAKKHGVGFHDVISKNTRQVYLFSKALCLWLEGNFCSGSYNKKLPEWFLFLPYEKQTETLKFYIRGDGETKDKKRSALRVSSRSETLAYQIFLVLIRIGYAANYHEQMDHGKLRFEVGLSGKSGKTFAEKTGIRLSSKKRRYNHVKVYPDYVTYPIKEVTLEEFSGYVYNLEVQKRHTYCVPVTVHNCWIEKDALVGIISGICNELDIPHFSCRGYTSQSEMWSGAMRLKQWIENGQTPVILHLGDHDPSGIDMTRDITERLELFMGGVTVDRLALNMNQIEDFNPPPNPAKLTDSRAQGYIAEFGNESWELDALEPQVMVGLIRDFVENLRDEIAWEEAEQQEEEAKERLRNAAESMEEENDDSE